MKKFRKGLTLVETVAAAGLLSLVIYVAASAIGFSTSVGKKGVDEFELQSALRSSGETITNTIRDSSAIFTIPASSYREGNLTDGWSYFGVEQVTSGGKTKSVITSYTYDFGAEKHVRKVVYEPPAGVRVKCEFVKNEPYSDNNLLEFSIVAVNEEDENIYGEVNSEVNALKALQVVDWGTELDRASAIAYRKTDMLNISSTSGNVVFVLDCSGSMEWNMKGSTIKNDTVFYNEARTNIMRRATQVFIEKLASSPRIYMSYVTYSSYVGAKKNVESVSAFSNVFENKNTLLNIFKPVYSNEINHASQPIYANGSTNTGDGIRIGIYHLKKKSETDKNQGKKTVNFLVVLTDGDSNRVTKKKNNRYYGEGLCGQNGITSTSDSALYANQMAERVATILPGTKTYLIGLGSGVSSSQRLVELKEALGCEDDNFFTAGDLSSLSDAFTSIADDITAEVWAITGPDL